MAEDLQALETWASGYMAKLEEGARRRLVRRIALDLRKSQSKRIGAQRDPDGAPFAPRRRPDLQERRNKIRAKASGPMFRKLRGTKYLRIQADSSQLSLGYAGTTARIALVHQLGLRDRVSPQPGSPMANYPERRLLGFTSEERGSIMDTILAHAAL